MTARAHWVAASIAIVSLAIVPSPAANAGPHADDLYIIETSVVEVEAPAPGETRTWSVPVDSADSVAHDVYVRLSAAEGPLFGGAHPAEITVSELGGEAILHGPARDVVSDTHTEFASIVGGSPLEIAGQLTLPRAAGNEYQGASGTLTLELAAVAGDEDSGGSTWIAATGSGRWWLIGAVSATAIITGITLVARRTTMKRTEDIP